MTVQTIKHNLVREFGQSLLSLSFNLGGILAGTLLVLYFDVFSIYPWVILIFPGILSIRGAIGGLFSGRLSTALHFGTIKMGDINDTNYFYLLLYAIISLTFISSVMMGVSATLFGAFFLGITIYDFPVIIATIIATMSLSLFMISPLTFGISLLTFKKGLDPDVIVYPIVSTIADILVTICYILVLKTLFSLELGWVLIVLYDLTFFIIVCYLLVRNFREKEFVKTIKEVIIALFFVAFFVNITGSVLGRIRHVIGNRLEIFVVYPAMITTIGGVGSIVGSTATTKLAFGTINSSMSSIKYHLTEISSTWFASLIMFAMYAVVASSMYKITVASDFLRFITQLLITNVISLSLMVVISFGVAIFTWSKGWDPDNFVIPVESSIADSITTISLFIALTLIP